MSDAAHRLRKAAIERAAQGAATTPAPDRRAAFDNRDVPAAAAALIDKVARNAWKVTDEDVTAAMGQATRQLDSALAAVDAAFAPAAKESA